MLFIALTLASSAVPVLASSSSGFLKATSVEVNSCVSWLVGCYYKHLSCQYFQHQLAGQIIGRTLEILEPRVTSARFGLQATRLPPD